MLLEPLNVEQRQAVETEGRPLFVLAGAGTGKTRVIAHRLAYLLKAHPEWSPANLLALTFSRKAAQEMLERVEALLGTYADDLGISTFHSFCHRFLTNHAVQLGLPPGFQLLDQMESWVFFRKILPEMKLRHYWSVSDPTGAIDGFLRFISRAKDELVTPDAYAAYAKTIQDRQERQAAQEAARVYRIYQERMREHRFFDFGDLIVETLRAFETQPKLLRELRNRFHSVLVDEFQDTNVAQIELLKRLVGTSGKLCVVGDDDQAIYRFRGASFASFLLMKEAFPDVETVRLSQNYRSSDRILAVADCLIRHNEPDRYDSEKRLWTERKGGPSVEVGMVRDEAHEAEAVVEKIQSLYRAQPLGERSYGRIAVLYRAHAHREQLVKRLRENGIPFLVRGGAALFEETAVQDLVAFLRLLADPDETIDCFRLVSHPVWGIPAQDLLGLSRLARERQVSLWALLQEADRLEMEETVQRAVAQFVGEVGHLQKQVPRLSIVELIERIAEETFLGTVFRLPQEETGAGDPWVSFGLFLRFVHRYARIHPQAQDLSSFLWYLDSAIRAGARETVEEEDARLEDRVRLMTVHQAKGLEFDWVILLGLTQNRFPARSRPESVPFPVALMKERLPEGNYHLQEERRLCYVACTRAREGLYLFTQDRAYNRVSVFVREMLEGAAEDQIVRRNLEADAEVLGVPATQPTGSLAAEREVLEIFRQIRSLEPQDEAGFTSALRRVTHLAGGLRGLDRVLKAPSLKFPLQERFSFTQLETYRYCPLKYRYAYLYRLPPKATPEMKLGVDLHATLEWFFAQIMKGQAPSKGQALSKKQAPALKDLLDNFSRFHTPGRYGEPYQDESYRKLADELLTAFYRRHEEKFPVPLCVERSFTLRLGEKVWVTGVVDRIDKLPEGGVEILDYKSGKPKEKASPEDQLQLRLYALAAEEVFGLEPKRVSFYYLRNNQKLSFEQEPQALQETRGHILEVAHQIQSGDYTATPSVGKCRRCDFKNLCPESQA